MLPIGEAAKQSGVTIETIRYYEREGVVPPPGRSASGRRLYDVAGIARLRFIKRCRDLGFSVPVTKTLLELSRENDAACSEVKAVAERHRAEVRRAQHVQSGGEGRFRRILRRRDHLAAARIAHRECEGQCPAHRSDAPVERELPHHADADQRARFDTARRGEHRDRDREIETRPGLSQFRGRQVDRHTAIRKTLTNRRNRGAHARGTLANRQLRQPDDVDPRQLGADPDLDLDRHAVHAEQCRADRPRHPGIAARAGPGGRGGGE